MRKIITITLLSLFFLAQFGKVISFCYCTIENYRLAGTTDCDCEKNLAGTITHESSKDHPSAAIHSLQYDELFHQPSFVINNAFSFTVTSNIFNNTDEPLYNAYLFAMLRPPSA